MSKKNRSKIIDDGGKRRKRKRSLVSGKKRTLKYLLGRGSMAAEAPPPPQRSSVPDERQWEESRCSVGDEIVSDRWRVDSSEGGSDDLERQSES